MEVSKNPYLLQQLFAREGLFLLPQDYSDQTPENKEEERQKAPSETTTETNKVTQLTREKPIETSTESPAVSEIEHTAASPKEPEFTHDLLIILPQKLDPKSTTRALLANIIKSLEIKPNTITMHYTAEEPLPEDLLDFPAPQIIAFLGKAPQKSLGFAEKAYQAQEKAPFWLLWSEHLEALENDKQKKLALWQALKKRFLKSS